MRLSCQLFVLPGDQSGQGQVTQLVRCTVIGVAVQKGAMLLKLLSPNQVVILLSVLKRLCHEQPIHHAY